MRQCKIDKILRDLNAARGLSYPMIGYSYYANIAGDGRKYRSIYTIINSGGGVTYSELNARSPAVAAKNIKKTIATIGQ